MFYFVQAKELTIDQKDKDRILGNNQKTWEYSVKFEA